MITKNMSILCLILASITALVNCKVGEVLHSSMLTIILPISTLMHYLETNTQNKEAQKALNIFSKLALIGLLMVLTSAFTSSDDDAIINNYIPILNKLSFISGLSIFLASGLLSALIAGSNIMRIVFALAAASLMISYRKIFYEISYPIDLHGYFEMLFLGPASLMSIISILLVYLLFQKILDAKTSILGEYPIGAASLIVIKHHFLSDIDSSKFFILSSIHIHMIHALLILFIFISLLKHFRMPNFLFIISILSLFIFTSFDFYNADKGNSVEYFRLSYNYGITISIMSYFAYILRDNKFYKILNIIIILQFLSSLIAVSGIYSEIGKVFANIFVILFAIICIVNMILERRKLGKK